MDLRKLGITVVVWATGYRPWYPWLAVPYLANHINGARTDDEAA